MAQKRRDSCIHQSLWGFQVRLEEVGIWFEGFFNHLYLIIVNNMQCTLISGASLVTDRPVVIFPIGYMYDIERFRIERLLLSTYWMFYTRPRCMSKPDFASIKNIFYWLCAIIIVIKTFFTQLLELLFSIPLSMSRTCMVSEKNRRKESTLIEKLKQKN